MTMNNDKAVTVTEQTEQAIRNLNMFLGENGSKTIVMESAQAEMLEWINEEPIIKAFHKSFQDYRIEEKSNILKANQSDGIKKKIEVMDSAVPRAEFRPEAGKLLKTMKETGASIETELSSTSYDGVSLKSNNYKHGKERGLHF
ncbi:unnamed protein product [Ceutorhynchus assimilis]|uniref:Uncharacterized protein n=1 Tax=Ceutorhynchus assimilis TaxID=467358 RepID=A0A9P0GPL1_9CUCU|nr:unnamed protein product [Ceutorhynchus assimilis]